MPRAWVLGLGFFLIAAAPPALGDWIKTRDGALIETRGPWKVKGSLVVFTATNGALSSIRLSEVDLDGSAVATFEAANPKEEAPVEVKEPEPVEPVLVITDKDISRARPPRPSGEEESDPAAEDALEGEGTAPPPPLVEVISWHRNESTDIDGVEIVGTLQNKGRTIVTDLRVMVRLFDEAGEFQDSANAFLGALTLAPNTTTRLRAVFPDVSGATVEPRFQVRSNAIQVEAIDPAKANQDASGDGNES